MSDERPSLPHGDHEYIAETARQIARNELLVADLSNQAWQISLALMMTRIAEYSNVALILVPKAPHVGLHWINNTAPGCVLSCQLVAQEDVEALEHELQRINAVLYPPPPQQQGTHMSIKVNGIEQEDGIIVDGDVHGDYSEDRLADVAVGFGLSLDDDSDPRQWRARIAISEEQGDGMEDNHRESLDNATTNLIEKLNDNTEGGYFMWEDGSVFLVADDEEDEDDEEQD